MSEIIEVLYQYHQGISPRKISLSLHISRNTIRKYLQEAKNQCIDLRAIERDELPSVALKLSKKTHKTPSGGSIPISQLQLAPLHIEISNYLKERYMTIRQLWRLLKDEHQITACEATVGRYVNKYIFKHVIQPVMVLPTVSGFQAQVDFASVGLMYCPIEKRRRKAYAFIMTLSHSRMRFVYFVFRQDTQTWIDCHHRAFMFFGGVPKVIVLDNLKAGVLKPDLYDPTLNRAYAECARYYGFIADPAKVRTPEHKGKVERSVTIVKQQVIAGRHYKDIQVANQFSEIWCRETIAHVVCRTIGETPWSCFERDERAVLQTLPEEPFETPVWQAAIVQRDSHVAFQGSFYSVPVGYIETTLWLRANTRLLQIYTHENVCLKTHLRSLTKGKWITDWQDIPQEKRKYIFQTKEQLLSLAQEMGSSVHEFVMLTLAETLTETRKRKINYLFGLAEHYGAARLNAACHRALMFSNTDMKSIQRILKNGLDAIPIETPKSSPSSLGSFLHEPRTFSLH